MNIEIQLTNLSIPGKILPPEDLSAGAWLEFRGVVRSEENGQTIGALEYEAYPEMAEREMRRLLNDLAGKHPCLAAKVIHRVGIIPVGEAAIYVGVAGKHRSEAFALLTEFMNRLKEDVPIWKRRSLAVSDLADKLVMPSAGQSQAAGQGPTLYSLDEAMAKIGSHSQPLLPIRVPLEECFGRVLCETVCALEDLPAHDRSTRDGYAILSSDKSESFIVVDALHAADWKPRVLRPGEAVRVATGAVLPCEGVRVVMQEQVERNQDRIKIKKLEAALNIRRRGEEVRAGQPVIEPGVHLNAGEMTLLAAVGCSQPLVSPRLRIAHFTTGDELVSPGETPRPGQIRDSNSILVRGLLQTFQAEVKQEHLPEDFELAWKKLNLKNIESADLLLISGGASVGDKDFTRQILERLGFKIIFTGVNVRPGKPLIFGVNGKRVAFGLPGNPLSHFVCFHFAVATTLTRMKSQAAPKFLRGRLAVKLDDTAGPRETLWPARLEWNDGSPRLYPLDWASSGDVTCLASANALIRVPAQISSLAAKTELDFLPAITSNRWSNGPCHNLDVASKSV